MDYCSLSITARQIHQSDVKDLPVASIFPTSNELKFFVAAI